MFLSLPNTALLVLPLVVLAALPETQQAGTPVEAYVLIFGPPSWAIESYLDGGVQAVDIMELEVAEKWVTARDFIDSLVGDIIESGNSYRIGVYDGLHDPVETLVEGVAEFPLRVTRGHGDPVRIVFEASEGRFATYFALVPHYDSKGNPTGPGLISLPYGREKGGWIGDYVLVNGVMVKNEHSWWPEPVERNTRVRIGGAIFDGSIVFVFLPPIPGWT